MQKRFVSLALGVLAIPVLGGVAYAAAHSVSDRPSPQLIIPASSRTATGGADDPATHEANHTQGTTVTTIHVAGADDTTRPANSATTPTTVRVSDDGVNHDAGDDHGGARTGATSTTVVGHDVGDDHGGASGSGSGSGGSGSGGSGSSGSGGSGSGRGSDDGNSGGHS